MTKDDHDHDSIWGSPSPPVQPAPVSSVRGNGEQEKLFAELQGMYWMSDEDKRLVARYMTASTPDAEAVGTCDQP